MTYGMSICTALSFMWKSIIPCFRCFHLLVEFGGLAHFPYHLHFVHPSGLIAPFCSNGFLYKSTSALNGWVQKLQMMLASTGPQLKNSCKGENIQPDKSVVYKCFSSAQLKRANYCYEYTTYI